MKTILLCLAFLPLGTFSQDTTTIEQYCEIKIASRPFSTKLNLYIDNGNQPRWAIDDVPVKNDQDNKPIVFNTRVDALNYMGRQGWQVVHVIPDSISNMYLMKRRVARNETSR